MVGGIMTNEIKELQAVQLKVDNSLWNQIVQEVQTLIPKIQEDTLTTEDMTEIRGLVATVRESSKAYNRYLNSLMTGYKQELESNLQHIGYPVIEQYINNKRAKQQQEVNERIAYKNEMFLQYVRQALTNTQYIANSALGNHIISFMHPLFPKLTSGAASKMMTERDWANVQTVVNNLLIAIDRTMTPLSARLPLHSETMKLYVDVLRTADVSKLQNLTQTTEADKMYYIEMILEQNLKTEQDVLNQINQIIGSDSDDKITEIQFVLNVWKKVGK